MQYRHIRTIGGKGSGPDQFAAALRGVAVDRHGLVHAAGDSEVKVYDPAGKLKRRWPTSKPALCVAVDADGSTWVGQDQQVEIFEAAGKPVGSWRLPARVTCIGFAGDGVLLGDAADRAIRHHDRAGKHRNTIGKDSPVRGFLIPNGVVIFGVDAKGVIHAANPGKHRVEQYSTDGKLLGRIGRFNGVDPAGFTGCCNPTNVAVRDRIFTAEKAGPRVKAYDFQGNLLAVIATGIFDPNCKNMSVAAGPDGRVWVTDTVRNTILAFEQVTA
jgi:sugar lactone lactonase YvrE